MRVALPKTSSSTSVFGGAAARLAWGSLPVAAFEKATTAYGEGVKSDLERGAVRFLQPERADYRQRAARRPGWRGGLAGTASLGFEEKS
jgi:hypothetical protein